MRLPSILKDLVPSDSVKQLMDLVNQPNLVAGFKDAAEKLGWKEAWGSTQIHHAMMQTKKWMEAFSERWATENHETLRLGINATGQILSSRWSSVPLSSQAISTFAVVAGGYSEPGGIAQDLHRLLLGFTGGQACLVTHSVEQAVALLRYAMPIGKGWAIPRADTIRLTSGCDVGELLVQDRQSLIEIGASNVCSTEDLDRAVEKAAGGFLLVKPSRLFASNEEARRFDELAVLKAKRLGMPMVELLLNGSLLDLSPFGIETALVSESVDRGMDAIVFPGDGWLGGPPCGILVGREGFLNPLIEHSRRLGLTAHPFIMATLHASMVASQDLKSWSQTPLGLMVSNGLENLLHRAKRLAIQLEGSPWIEKVVAETGNFAVAANPIESTQLDSGVLRIEPRGMSPKELQAKLLARETPLWSLADDRFLSIVLRTVEPADDQEIIAAFIPNPPPG